MNEKINGFRYHTLYYLLQYPDKIPDAPGIYNWVHWPNISTDMLPHEKRRTLDAYSAANLTAVEHWSNFRFSASISESSTGTEKKPLLGLSNEKSDTLTQLLGSKEGTELFAETFKFACFTRPFYVGKADSLQSRLGNDHFKGRTKVLAAIANQGILNTAIWIGYRELSEECDSKTVLLLEEILQRIVKPQLVERVA